MVFFIRIKSKKWEEIKNSIKQGKKPGIKTNEHLLHKTQIKEVYSLITIHSLIREFTSQWLVVIEGRMTLSLFQYMSNDAINVKSNAISKDLNLTA